MKVLGITGGIGSGKSLVSRIFIQLGVPVYEADAEVKRMYREQDSLIALLRNKFPTQLFDKNGKPDTGKFASFFFNQDTELEKLNDIVHPFVKEHFQQWVRSLHAVPYVIKEAAILFESGSDKGCDRIAAVAAPAEIRLDRVMQRDKRNKSEVQHIMNRQWSDEQRNAKADFVISNDGNQLVIPQVLNIHRQMLKLESGEK